ncbi:glycoprotein [Ouango virus]|uniref:Glycoprotein n=1 Tax=Ouango virus TaxID=864692 RepID=A0AAE9BMT8_9RHAB|nr:glycoprotein [Ouango virus]UAU42892.1 glycoprotein [Ouango virus]
MKKTLVFALLWSIVATYEYIYFPTKLLTDFKPTKTEHLNCPYDIDDTEIENYVKIKGKILKQNLVNIDGLLCFKQKWTTKCEENFFGHQTYSHKIDHVSIDDIPSNYATKEEGESPPDVDCKWMSESKAEDTRTYCVPTQIKYDEMYNIGMNPTLGSFKCNKNVCRVDNYHLFKSNITDLDKGYQDIELTFSVDENKHVTEDSFVKSSSFPKMSLNGACIDFVTKNSKFDFKMILASGLLFEFNTQFDFGNSDKYSSNVHVLHNLDDLKKLLYKKGSNEVWSQYMFNENGKAKMRVGSDVTGTLKTLHQILVNLRVCQTNDYNRVKVPTLDFQRTITEMFVESKIDQLSCKKRLYEIMTENKISGADLGLLAQNHEGVGPVYHRYKNDITVALGKYERFYWSPSNSSLGYTQHGDKKEWINCKEWVPDEVNSEIKWCYNGIFKRGDKFYHPIFGGDDIEDLKIAFQEKDLRKVDHISLAMLDKERNKEKWIDYHKLETTYKFTGLEKINKWWESLSEYIKYSVYGIGVIISVYSLFKIFNRKKYNNRRFL